MVNIPTIELPRLENESAQAYQAACAYVEMGADRSQQAVSQKLAKSRQIMNRWSRQHDWVERARVYDAQLAELAAERHQKRYLADLADHQKRATEAAKGLYTVAGKLLQRINTALEQPRKIKGEDGVTYTLHNIELNAATFATAARAMQTSLDLEAHALGIDRVENDDSE